MQDTEPEEDKEKKWIDNIKDILDKGEYGAIEAIHLALDRKQKLPP